MKERLKKLGLRCLSWLCHRPYMKGRITLSELVFRVCKPKSTIVRMKVGAIPIELDLSELEARFIYFGAYERHEINFLRACLKEGDVVVDVGANVGYISAVMASLVGPKGRVYALEADPHNYSKLKVAEELSDGIIKAFWLAAVDRTDGHDPFVLFYQHPTHPMWSSTVRETCDVALAPISVPALSLDDFLFSKELTNVALIKIDVEGGEAKVLKGMQQYLERGARPILLCELVPWLHAALGMNSTDILDLVSRHNYRTFRFGRNGRLAETTSQSISSENGTMNVAFMPEERAGGF